MVLGKFPPGEFPPEKFSPIKIHTQETTPWNIPPGKLPPRKFSPGMFLLISLIVILHLTFRLTNVHKHKDFSTFKTELYCIHNSSRYYSINALIKIK